MKTSDPSHLSLLAEKISEAEAKLKRLECEIADIGQPAAHELKRRVGALKIEARALRRNFEESQSGGGSPLLKLEKVELLLQHIEAEESSVEHAAAFLHQAAPSSVILAAEAGAKVFDAFGRGVKKVLGENHPFGSSVFVNHTHEALVSQFGLNESGARSAGARPS